VLVDAKYAGWQPALPEMMMEIRELKTGTEHERVVECVDTDNGYHGIAAIHSTALGPAVGGTRVWNYASFDDALTDVLRLSRGMSYKAATAGLYFGGGKCVIIADNARIDRQRVFRAHGRFINYFQGRFITGEDVGTTPADMEIVRGETQFVAGTMHGSGDPSPFTARGVFFAMKAAAELRWNSGAFKGRTVAIQGCGHVGYHLARELHGAGAKLVVADIDRASSDRVVREMGARGISTDEIFDVDADVFAPCALGGILNDATIPRLRVAIVCGAANNQLGEPRHGDAIEARGIVYVPDYVANAGGLIHGASEVNPGGHAVPSVEGIYATTREVLELAKTEKIAASEAADRLAERRLKRK
jgi:leucine dehydrogenase